MMDVERVSSGSETFDALIGGGFLKGSAIVLQSPVCNEADTFTLQFIIEGLKRSEPVLVLVSKISPVDFKTQLLFFASIDLEKVEAKGLLKIIDWYSYRFAESSVGPSDVIICGKELQSVVKNITDCVLNTKIERAYIDFTSHVLTTVRLDELYENLEHIVGVLKNNKITTLFLVNKHLLGPDILLQLDQIFDGVLDIDREKIGPKIMSTIGILSLRSIYFEPVYREIELSKEGFVVKGVKKTIEKVPVLDTLLDVALKRAEKFEKPLPEREVKISVPSAEALQKDLAALDMELARQPVAPKPLPKVLPKTEAPPARRVPKEAPEEKAPEEKRDEKWRELRLRRRPLA